MPAEAGWDVDRESSSGPVVVQSEGKDVEGFPPIHTLLRCLLTILVLASRDVLAHRA